MASLVCTSLALMVFAVLGVHLGLFKAVVGVLGKIAECGICSTFWLAVVVLPLMGASPFVSLVLAMVTAFASIWFVVLIVELQKIYEKWQRKNNSSRRLRNSSSHSEE